MSTEPERMQILKMIEDGLITPVEGLKLLKALEDDSPSGDAPEGDAAPDAPPGFPTQAEVESSPEASFSPIEPVNPAPASKPAEPSVAGAVAGPASDQPAQVGWKDPSETQPVEGEVRQAFHLPPKFGKWQRWWQIPLAAGLVITVAGALLMFLAWQAAGVGFWFACAWFPFLFGVGLVALAWASRSLRWLHLRVQQKPGEWPQTIAISLPLPLRLVAWAVRMFGHRIPNMDAQTLDQMILALEKTSPEAPFYLQVNEDEDGERVEIFIG